MGGSLKRWGVVAALSAGLAFSGGQSSVGAVVCAFIIQLLPFTSVTGPSGLDYHQPSDSIIASTTEVDATFKSVHPVTGVKTPFSGLAGLPGGLKLATVRSGACLAGFVPGDMYAGTGTPGGLLKVSGGVPTYPWVTLPGEPGVVTGVYQDQA